jgi:hypothetical protein
MQTIPTSKGNVYSGKFAGAAILFIGIMAFICGAAISSVSKDPWLAAFLMGLPACVLGSIAMLSGIASLSTRIEIGTDLLMLAAPRWRGCPLPPVTKMNVRWDSIKTLRHRKEVYHLLPGKGLPMPVDAYVIDIENKKFVFVGKAIPHLTRAFNEIEALSGHPLREEPSVQAGIIKSFMKGPPCWDKASS